MKYSLTQSSSQSFTLVLAGKAHTILLVPLCPNTRVVWDTPATSDPLTLSSSAGRLVTRPDPTVTGRVSPHFHQSIPRLCKKRQGPAAIIPFLSRPVSLLPIAFPTSRPLPYSLMFFQKGRPLPVTLDPNLCVCTFREHPVPSMSVLPSAVLDYQPDVLESTDGAAASQATRHISVIAVPVALPHPN